MSELALNLEKACRICMRDTVRRTKSIFTRNEELNLTLAEMIGVCSSNSVIEADGIPQQICSGCEQDLRISYNFRVRCDDSYKNYQKLLQKMTETPTEFPVEIKVEETETNKALTPRMKYKRKLEDIKEEIVDFNEEDFGDDENYEIEHLASSEDEEEQENKKVELSDEAKEVLATITQDPSSFEALTDTENNRKIYQCKTCGKRFSRQTHVKRHMLTHSNIKPFKCQHCEKSFSRSDHLQKHAVLHSATRTYTCEICPNRSFTRPESLKNHMKRHTNEPEVKTEKKFPCEKCSRSFSSQKYLEAHVASHDTPKTFNCKFCPEVFEQRKDLHAHNKIHINERPFLCSECGQRFLRNDYLVIHMRRHKGEKPYKCKFCEKCFPRATDLTVHERYHTDAKTHLCTTCGKGFHRAYNLLVHMRVHTGEKPYKCPHCVKSFAQGNDLKAHVRRHTGERFKCEICNKGFIQGYHLTNHKRDVHGIDERSHIRRLEKFKSQSAQQIQVLFVAQQEQLSELMRQKAALEASIRLNVDSKLQETDQQIQEMKIQLLEIEEQRQRILLNEVTQEQYDLANAAIADAEESENVIKLENDMIEVSVETQVETT
ncbi:zinc finger protein 436-like [Culicoides brevitarsis]|uniref:zinc finger protein 436-like n=1 Tax=Culicoides brevitarsis TaxID=469753 RepID=UPI00307BF02E